MIKLYIAQQLVDIDNKTSIALTYQYENVYNPAAIQNTYSKTVSLPSTPTNDAVFDHIWSLSHSVLDFNPSKRVDFVLTDSNTVIESGYLQLISIEYSGQYPRKYNIELYGQRGNFFLSLVSNPDSDEQLYLDNLNVDPANYNHTINAETVESSFANDYYRYILSYSGQYDNFDSDQIFTAFSGSGNILVDSDYGNGTLFLLTRRGYILSTDNGENFSTYEGLETFPREISDLGGVVYGELDSVFFVYSGARVYYTANPEEDAWSSILIEEGTNVVAIDISLNSTSYWRYAWLTQSGNYYHSNTIGNGTRFPVTSTGFPNLSNSKRPEILRLTYNDGTTIGFISAPNIRDGLWHFNEPQGAVQITFNQSNYDGFASGVNSIKRERDQMIATGYVYATSEAPYIYYAIRSGSSDPSTYNWTTLAGFYGYGFVINDLSNNLLLAYGPNGRIVNIDHTQSPPTFFEYTTNIQEYYIHEIIYGDGYYHAIITDTDGAYYAALSIDLSEWTISPGVYDSIDTDELNEHQRNEFRSYYQRPALRMKHIFTQILEDSDYSYSLSPQFFTESNPYWEKTWLIMRRLQYDGEVPEDHVGNVRSGDAITFRMMVTKGISRFEFLLSFLKTFGLVIQVDKTKKHVTIQTRNEYFSDSQIMDWTDKQDYRRPLKILPLIFNYRYGIMQYGNAGSYYEDLYKEKYNREYGYSRIDTEFEFNNTETSYIPSNTFQNVIMSTEYNREFDGRNPDDRYADDKILPALFTKSANSMSYNDSSMHIVFIDGMTDVNIPIRITDDNPFMLDTGLFSWNNSGGITTSRIPNVLRVLTQSGKSYSLDFSRPQDLYYQGEYPDEIGLYDRFYRAYVEERLYINNKKIETYFNISPIDIQMVDFNDFILINNNLWHTTKIVDYTVDGRRSTKTELIRVKDRKAYTDGQKLDWIE